MDQSEEQFRDLIANLIPRVNNALCKANTGPTIGLLLLESGDVEVVLAVSNGCIPPIPPLCDRPIAGVYSSAGWRKRTFVAALVVTVMKPLLYETPFRTSAGS